MTVHLGTSGWQYRHWRGRFYPTEERADEWLGYYAARFATVEVNSTFYRLPERPTFEDWAEATPDDFVVAMKASRYITHTRRLREPREPIRLMLDRARGLGRKLGPILLQLPPTLRRDLGRLEEALAAFPSRVRVAVEFRHESWFRDAVRDVLARRKAALCLADRGEESLTPLWRTAGWGYLRLHGGRGSPRSCYRPSALAGWADRLAELWPEGDDVYVYFNNDAAGCAVRDAARLGKLLDERGRPRTRTDAPTELRRSR